MKTQKKQLSIIWALFLSLSLIISPAQASSTSNPPQSASNIEALSYPSDPTSDIAWSGGTSGVADIQSAFNNARNQENSQLGTSLPPMVLPNQTTWDSMTDNEKSLWLINQERVARGVMPLDNIKDNVTGVAQYYADYLLDNDAWGHTEDGNSPWDRLDNNPAIGACHDFLSVSENLAVFVTSGNSIALPIERSIFMWLYDDSGSSWGHRHAILWYPYNDNSGQVGKEGFLGIGRANGGPYQGTFSSSWNFAEIIVMNVFDPCSTWVYPAPEVINIIRTDHNPSGAATVDFTVTFSEPVTGVDTSDFALTTTGVSGASVLSLTGSGTTYTVTVNTGSGNGTIRLDVSDDDTIVDGAGNPLGGIDAGNGDYTSGESYTIETPSPFYTTEFGYGTGWVDPETPRMLADVDGDGINDIVGFSADGAIVALGDGYSFAPGQLWEGSFGTTGGWDGTKHIRTMADVNGDGKADLVGFGDYGVLVSLSIGSGFSPLTYWSYGYGSEPAGGGWNTIDNNRVVADVNGDGKADIVGYGLYGVMVSLSNGSSFGTATYWTMGYGKLLGGWDGIQNPRMIADLNGDGCGDVVGFANYGVLVSLSNACSGSNTFGTPSYWAYGYAYLLGGWDSTKHVRTFGDVNNDGADDLVGFGDSGVLVSLSNGSSLAPAATYWKMGYGYVNGGWRVDRHPRMVADVNADGMADVVGFATNGVLVSSSNGGSFP